jgi:hypothetical protein
MGDGAGVGADVTFPLEETETFKTLNCAKNGHVVLLTKEGWREGKAIGN